MCTRCLLGLAKDSTGSVCWRVGKVLTVVVVVRGLLDAQFVRVVFLVGPEDCYAFRNHGSCQRAGAWDAGRYACYVNGPVELEPEPQPGLVSDAEKRVVLELRGP